MFEPNALGELRTRLGRDIHGRATYGPLRGCPFAAVNLAIGSQRTTVRADSSASRGATDETVAMRAKILVPTYVTLAVGDLFLFDQMTFDISAVHPRRGVSGLVDHYEIDMELT